MRVPQKGIGNYLGFFYSIRQLLDNYKHGGVGWFAFVGETNSFWLYSTENKIWMDQSPMQSSIRPVVILESQEREVYMAIFTSDFRNAPIVFVDWGDGTLPEPLIPLPEDTYVNIAHLYEVEENRFIRIFGDSYSVYGFLSGEIPFTLIEVENCSMINTLVVADSAIETLDMSKNIALKYLGCENCTNLTSLDVSNNVHLESFDISNSIPKDKLVDFVNTLHCDGGIFYGDYDYYRDVVEQLTLKNWKHV